MMATAAYAADNVLTRGNHCPDLAKLGVRQPGDSDETYAFNTSVRGFVSYLNSRNWQCRFGLIHSLPCPRDLGPDCRPISGLGFQIWRRTEGGVCREVVIAFRGTDRNDRGDWTSNFRFLYRLTGRFDQYDQVRLYVDRVVERVRKRGCGAGTLFVSAGHSLGGGLAQQAAYAGRDITYVYGFDPSPVTGIFDVSVLMRERNTRGVGIDRAYEAGEILALPRILIENIIPPTPCGPRIRTVRFNMLTGLPSAQHSITELTAKLRTAAQTPGTDARRASALTAARDCVGPPLIAPPA
jgi:hypothetical protein